MLAIDNIMLAESKRYGNDVTKASLCLKSHIYRLSSAFLGL